jgi:hypothetical protein
MARNNADFIGGMLHGSKHSFNPGDVIEPRNPGKTGTDLVAWASNSSHAAKIYGGEGATIYQVEPIGKYDTLPGPRIDEEHYMSRQGFRVLGTHDGQK